MIGFRSRHTPLIWSVWTGVLLLVYTASSIRLDSIHQLFHVENITELHSVEKESDPCHKNIYHQQKESGCEHKSHITQNTKCPICEYNNNNAKEILPNQSDTKPHFESAEFKFNFQEGHPSAISFQHSGRAPPFI